MWQQSNKQSLFTQKHPTQKQFNQISLFKNVKLINGERAWKTIYKNCYIFQFQISQRVPIFQIKQFFYLVHSGCMQVYKHEKHNQNLKGLIRSFKKDEYSGYQDFPLFLSQKLQIYVVPNTIIYAIKLQVFYQCFRRVLPLNSLQSKGQYLKKIMPFNNIQIQKILRLSCFVQRRRCHSNCIVVQQRCQIQNLIIIMQGRCQSIDQINQSKIIYGKHQIIGLQEIVKKQNYYKNTIICTYQSQLILIPKERFLKLYEIKFKLNENIEKQILFEQNANQFQAHFQKNLKDSQNSNRKENPLMQRAKTEGGDNFQRSYSMSQRSSKKRVNKMFFTNTQFYNKNTKFGQNQQSLSQIHKKKFLDRKQKLESSEIIKHIKSKVPQLTLNPYKQFAIIPALHIKGSNYVKNFKRKLKKSNSIFKNSQIIDY